MYLKLMKGDVSMLKTLPDEHVDTIITSPPYKINLAEWGLRDYGKETNIIWGGDPECEHEWGGKITKKLRTSIGPNAVVGSNRNEYQPRQITQGMFCSICGAWYGQLGLEPSLELYLTHLLEITSELKRVLKKTGVMFWNHGDSYATNSGSGEIYSNIMPGYEEKVGSSGLRSSGFMEKQGIPRKSLFMQNYRLIMRMVDEQGWVLRNTIIWEKPNHLPSSVKDRLSNSYEPVFMLVKSEKYFFNLDAVRVPHAQASIDRLFRGVNPGNKYDGRYGGNQPAHTMNKPRQRIPKDIRPGAKEELYQQENIFPCGGSNKRISSQLINLQENILEGKGKNPGDLWRIPTQSFPEAHFATFPERLVEPLIKAGCPGDGIVLDPFLGSGTTMKVSRELRRSCIGVELNPEYITLAKERVNWGSTVGDIEFIEEAV